MFEFILEAREKKVKKRRRIHTRRIHKVHGVESQNIRTTVLVLSLKESAQHRSLSELFGIPSDSWK